MLIIDDKQKAADALKEMLVDGKFGEAGSKVVIEEFLSGIELSVFVLTDGKSYVILPEAKDYKRIGEGDKGLNTGGMGSISPVSFAKGEFMSKVEERVIKPTVNGLAKEGIPYNGFMFIGLMNVDGDPQVIEYNCRMGDPETESVMPRIKSDFLRVLWNCGKGEIAGSELVIDDRTAACVMLVSGGYPESYEIITSGGRVIAFTSLEESLEGALSKTYSTLSNIKFDKMYYRKDIGFDLK